MRLTRGEGFWLGRRRAGFTAERTASWIGISVDRFRRWELDREPAPFPDQSILRRTRLTPGEFAALCRRRTGLRLEDLAERLGISRHTLWKREHDRTRSAWTLAEYWRRRGIPPARTATPIGLGEPERRSKNMRRSMEDRGGPNKRKSS